MFVRTGCVPLSWVLSIILAVSPLLTPIAFAEQSSLPKEDLIAPEIIHIPINESLEPGASLELSATVTDNVKVKAVEIFYRVIGDAQYSRLNMSTRYDNSTEYVITLDSDVLEEPGIEYYIRAEDISGNSLLYGYSLSPLKVAVGEPFIDEADTSEITAKPEESSYKWLWITLGVLAVGALASGGSGGGDSGGGDTSGEPGGTASLVVSGPAPE